MRYHVIGRPHDARHSVDAWQQTGVVPAPDWVPVTVPEGWWVLRDYRGEVTTASPQAFAEYYELVP